MKYEANGAEAVTEERETTDSQEQEGIGITNVMESPALMNVENIPVYSPRTALENSGAIRAADQVLSQANSGFNGLPASLSTTRGEHEAAQEQRLSQTADEETDDARRRR